MTEKNESVILDLSQDIMQGEDGLGSPLTLAESDDVSRARAIVIDSIEHARDVEETIKILKIYGNPPSDAVKSLLGLTSSLN